MIAISTLSAGLIIVILSQVVVTMMQANIEFTIAALEVKHRKERGFNILLGYKVSNTENVYSSFGYPQLMKNEHGRIYTYNAENIFFQLRLLSEDQEAELIKEANHPETVIYLTILQGVTCVSEFKINGRKITLYGSAYNLDQYELMIQVPCPENSQDRADFNSKTNVRWRCTFQFGGKKELTNRETISAEIMQEALTNHSIFGDKEEVLMTREQVTLFSHEVQKNLQSTRKFEYDDFDGQWDETLLLRIYTSLEASFKSMTMDEMYKNLSKFGLDVTDKDWRPDVITSKLNELSNRIRDDKKQGLSSSRRNMNSRDKSSGTNYHAKIKGSVLGYGAGLGGSHSNEKASGSNNEHGHSNDKDDQKDKEAKTFNQNKTTGEITEARNKYRVAVVNKFNVKKYLDITKSRRVQRDQQTSKTHILSDATYISKDPMMDIIGKKLKQLDESIDQLESMTSSVANKMEVVQEEHRFSNKIITQCSSISVEKQGVGELKCEENHFVQDMKYTTNKDGSIRDLISVNCCQLVMEYIDE